MNENEDMQFNELKKDIKRAADWEVRLAAVRELGQLQSDEAIKVLKYVAKADLVTKVREAAGAALKKMGEPVPVFEPPKGGYFKDERKVLVRIKKSLPADHSYEDFKEKLAKMRSDMYNTYEGEQGAGFDAWLKELWENTATRR